MHTIVCNSPSIALPHFFIFRINSAALRLKISLFLLSGCLFLDPTTLLAEAMPPDTAYLSLSGANSICAGQSAVFSVDFSGGTAPFIFTPIINGVAQTPVNSPVEPVVFQSPIPAGNNTVLISNCSANGIACDSFGTVNITGVQATAVLSGGGDLCFNGPGDSLTVVFTGPGPYTFVYSINGVAQAPITTAQQVYKIFVNPIMYTKYQLVSLTAQGCPGVVSGMAEIFVFVSSNATLAADATFCNGVNTTLLVNLTGTAPFTLTYAVNGQVQPPITVQDSPISLPINITQTTVYSLISIESPGCLQPETDSQVITINYPPNYSNITFDCNLVNGTYTVGFEVVNGTPPYTLLAGTGTFVGNLFTSQPIPIANNYNFTFRDANNCGDIVVTGSNTCNCTSNAGNIDTTPMELCWGESATVVHNGDETLDNNDTLKYILHTLPSLPVGQILAWSDAPTIPFVGGIQPGVTYYISAIAGDNAGNGQVDLNDLCLSVSTGAPVLWRTLPGASLEADTNICIGAQVQLPVQLTGAAPFDITYTRNGVSITETGVQSPFALGGSLLADAEYILTAVSDVFCSAAIADTARVDVHPLPEASAPLIICDPNTFTYTVAFSMLSGDTASIGINGITGVYNALTGQFLSDPLPENDTFRITISDQWMCGTDTLTGVSGCFCYKVAGTIAGDTLDLCYGLPIDLPLVTGSDLNPSDTLVYFLANDTIPETWTIISQGASPDFSFIPGQTIPGALYYVVAVAAQKLLGGINLSDPCRSISPAIPVKWRNNITAAVSGNASICEGAGTPILVQLAGGSPYSFDIMANNTLFQSVSNTNNGLSFFTVTPTETTVYAVANLTSGGCTGTAVTNATVTVNPIPEIVGLQQICDPSELNYTLQFGISNGASVNDTYTISGITGLLLTDTIFISDSYPAATPYTITVSSSFGCSSAISGSGTCGCATKSGTLTPLKTQACPDDMVSATYNNDAVLDQNDVLAYFICDDPGNIPQSILATSTTPAFGFLPGMSLNTDYFIFVVAGDLLPDGTISYTDPCTSLSGGILVQFHEAPTLAMPVIDTAICQGQGFQIPLTLTGLPPFRLSYRLNGVLLPEITTSLPSFVISTTNIQSDQFFELVGISDASCSGTVTGSALIRVKKQPVVTLLGNSTICPGQDATLYFNLENASSAEVELLSNTEPPQTLTIQAGLDSLVLTAFSNATFSLGNVVFMGNDCPGKIQGTATITVSPISITANTSNFKGFGVSCHDATDGFIQLTPTGGGGQYNYVWSNGAAGSTATGLEPGDYFYTVTDQLGCVTSGTAIITQPDQLVFEVAAVPPHCPGLDDGKIEILQITGGVPSYNMELNQTIGVSVIALPTVIDNLSAGTYSLQLTDANGCTAVQSIPINDPLEVIVSLGDDKQIFLGDSVLLEAEVNVPDIVKYNWVSVASLRLETNPALAWATPVKTATYSVTVTDSEGCTATDEVVVEVKRDDGLFIPTVFSPGSNDENAVFTVFAGREILQVNFMQVYDRWGALIFENKNFAPNDSSAGWDGQSRQKDLPPGVYYYVLEVVKYGGVTELMKGDITIVR